MPPRVLVDPFTELIVFYPLTGRLHETERQQVVKFSHFSWVFETGVALNSFIRNLHDHVCQQPRTLDTCIVVISPLSLLDQSLYRNGIQADTKKHLEHISWKFPCQPFTRIILLVLKLSFQPVGICLTKLIGSHGLIYYSLTIYSYNPIIAEALVQRSAEKFGNYRVTPKFIHFFFRNKRSR